MNPTEQIFQCLISEKDKKRFLDKIKEQENGCWFIKDENNYHQFWHRGRNVQAHRFSYTLFFGDFDLKILVLHKCDQRNCVNPKHLFLGTYQDNTKDMFSKSRGNTSKGESHYKSLLTQAIVDDVRKMRDSGLKPKDCIIKYPSIPQSAIRNVIQDRRRWL